MNKRRAGPNVIRRENILKDFAIQFYLKFNKTSKIIINIYDYCKESKENFINSLKLNKRSLYEIMKMIFAYEFILRLKYM